MKTPTPDQLNELRYSGFDGSEVSQAEVDESFRRIIEAEAAEVDETETPSAFTMFAMASVIMPLATTSGLMDAPEVRTEYTSDSSARTETVLYYQLHHAATTSLSAILALFKPGGRTVSAQSAAKDNVIVRTVQWARRAWTSGSNYVDQRSDTIEVANSSAGGSWPVSNRTFHTVAWDIAQWSIRRKRTINDSNVITHQEIPQRWPGQSYATACPGDMQRRKGELIALAKRYFEALTGSTAKPKQKPGELRITTYPFGVYAVAKGETPAKVAAKFGMSLSRFYTRNGVDPDKGFGSFKVGQLVNVAVDYAPKGYQYLDLWNEHTLATVQVQVRLGVTPDGEYGSQSFNAVANFQDTIPGLSRSGRVDRATWNALFPDGEYVPIVQGTTLWGVAAEHGTTVAVLEKLNPGVDASSLRIGGKLRVK